MPPLPKGEVMLPLSKAMHELPPSGELAKPNGFD